MPSFPAFNRLKNCRYGQMLYNQNDAYIGRSLDLYGEFSEGEAELFRQVIQPGFVVVEIGANIGAHTLLLAQLVTASGAVIAVEPQRILFQTLCANMALNSVPNAYCMQRAMGATHGSVVIPPIDYTVPGNFGGLSLGNYQSGEQVPVSRLDDLMLPSCNFLKIDVEGMELEVLQGGASMIARFQPVIYCENDRPDKSEALIRHLASLSYSLYWHRPAYFNPQNFLGNPTNVFPNLASHNMVGIPPGVPHQLNGLPPVEIPPA